MKLISLVLELKMVLDSEKQQFELYHTMNVNLSYHQTGSRKQCSVQPVITNHMILIHAKDMLVDHTFKLLTVNQF